MIENLPRDWHGKAEILLKLINQLSVLHWTLMKQGDKLILYCAEEAVSGPTEAENTCWLLGGILLSYTRRDEEDSALGALGREVATYVSKKDTKKPN